MELASNATLLKADEAQSRPIDSGTVIVNMASGACFELNRIGSEIWELLDGTASVVRICEVLGSRYAVAKGQLETDVRNLIGDLIAAGLVEPNSSLTP